MFSFNERLGVFLTVEASFLSLVAVASILCFVIYKWLRRTVTTWGKSVVLSKDATDSSLFLNLMFADMIQAIGNMPSIRWMEDGFITEGQLCTAQAAVKQVGIVGVALTSLAIGVQTFSILVLRWRAPKHISKLLVVGIWIFAGLVIGIPNAVHRNTVYYGNTGYWCWILQEFKTEQIVTEYLWVWSAGILMVILYGIMFVVMRGWVILDDEGVHWYRNYRPQHANLAVPETEEDKVSKEIANLMLFYPAVYVFCVFPNSLSRWLYFSGFQTPYQFTLFASTLFALSGLFNVILFFSTRPDLVKGPNVIIESEALPLHQHHRKDSSSISVSRLDATGGGNSSKLGRLPERNYAYNYSDNTTMANTEPWPSSAVSGQSYTDALISNTSPPPLPPPSGLHSSYDNYSYAHSSGGGAGGEAVYSSPTAFNGALALPAHARTNSYRSDELKRSKESASLMEEEEEDYGWLPGA
ncbi:hypothetical protein JR316_0001766 [Psilocybe cubensis]|uniref:Uncharacterized protein n=2 Tax=Psilocybe cubensis TaxID=181762 RepID=A0ACB8HCE0_PSICU|nr:hypothetical protein JR316_0001766 [Psilocybe cubensis]KAH9484864.1 hypothetical protein JR316_0001766 [Psilocybe cubensis]